MRITTLSDVRTAIVAAYQTKDVSVACRAHLDRAVTALDELDTVVDRVRPISPAEALADRVIPAPVIHAVNELLTERFDGHSCVLHQDEVIERVLARFPGRTRDDLFTNHWLDFEPLFARHGWLVEYDRPAYNETYEPTWRFTKRTA